MTAATVQKCKRLLFNLMAFTDDQLLHITHKPASLCDIIGENDITLMPGLLVYHQSGTVVNIAGLTPTRPHHGAYFDDKVYLVISYYRYLAVLASAS